MYSLVITPVGLVVEEYEEAMALMNSGRCGQGAVASLDKTDR